MTNFEGRVWHIAHLQMSSEKKADRSSRWNAALEAEVLSKASKSKSGRCENEFRPDGIYKNTDNRAQFSGCVLYEIPSSLISNVLARDVYLENTLKNDGHDFGSGVDFTGSLLKSGADIYGFADGDISFASIISFRGIQFSVRTDGAVFFEHSRIFGYLDLQSCNIGRLEAANAEIFGDFFLYSAKILDRCALYKSTFHSSFDAEQCDVGGEFILAWSEVNGSIDITGVKFRSKAIFKSTRFNAEFISQSEPTKFFPSPITYFYNGMSFENCYFNGTVDLSKARWRGKERPILSGAVFNRLVVWPDREAHSIDALAGAMLKGGISIRSFGEKGDRGRFSRWSLSSALSSGQEGLQALETGARILKESFAVAGDHSREQRYYRFELLARQKQPSSPFSERFFSSVFELVSDFGLALVRPLATLLVTAILFAGLYLVAAPSVEAGVYEGMTLTWLAPVHPSVASAIELALTNMFGPFSYIVVETPPYTHLNDGQASFKFRLVMGALSVLQQIISLLLIFLFGLAVRRRFQIG